MKSRIAITATVALLVLAAITMSGIGARLLAQSGASDGPAGTPSPSAEAARGELGVPAFSEPGISPDGREIAFVSGGDIWTVSASGGEARLLISNPAIETRPLFSPDGKMLAFGSTRTGNGDVYLLVFATGELKRMTYDDGNETPTGWSHDGKWIYFQTT